MAEFEGLPLKIQQLAEDQLNSLSIRFCAVGGSQVFQPDFVLVTTNRILVLTEQSIGLLSYAAVRCNLDFQQIKSLTVEQTLWQKLTYQSRLKIETTQEIYFVNGLGLPDAKRIITLIKS